MILTLFYLTHNFFLLFGALFLLLCVVKFAIVSQKKKKSQTDKANVSRLRTNNLKEKVFVGMFLLLLFFRFLSFSLSVEIEIFGTIFSDYHMRTMRGESLVE